MAVEASGILTPQHEKSGPQSGRKRQCPASWLSAIARAPGKPVTSRNGARSNHYALNCGAKKSGLASWLKRAKSPSTGLVWRFHDPPNLEMKYRRAFIFCQEEKHSMWKIFRKCAHI